MLPARLRDYIRRTYALPDGQIEQLWQDIVAALSEEPADYIRRRHRELRDLGLQNAEILPKLVQEVPKHLFRGPALSERQIRRIIHG